VLGIIKRESRGDPTAYNSSFGASGLMQHLAKYWSSRAAGAGFVDSSGRVASPFNGAANIAAGKWLADYYEGRGSNWWAPWSRLPSYGSCGS
jgi:soluble lytic murein transglycosylase-like protein